MSDQHEVHLHWKPFFFSPIIQLMLVGWALWYAVHCFNVQYWKSICIQCLIQSLMIWCKRSARTITVFANTFEQIWDWTNSYRWNVSLHRDVCNCKNNQLVHIFDQLFARSDVIVLTTSEHMSQWSSVCRHLGVRLKVHSMKFHASSFLSFNSKLSKILALILQRETINETIHIKLTFAHS